MQIDTWAVVAATCLGPIFAVLATRYVDDRKFRRERKMSIFRILMGTRRMPFNLEHVHALNLIEVDFHGDQAVVMAWRSVADVLNQQRTNDPEVAARWASELEKRKSQLLQNMAHSLRYDITHLDLFGGGYAPSMYDFREQRLSQAFDYVRKLAAGEAVLPVRVEGDGESEGIPTQDRPNP